MDPSKSKPSLSQPVKRAPKKSREFKEWQQLIVQGRKEVLTKRNYLQGEELLRKALQLASNEPKGKAGSPYLSTLHLLIRALTEQEKYDQALTLTQSYRTLLESGGGDAHAQPQPMIYLYFARLYRKAGQFQNALDACQLAMEKSSKNSNWRHFAPPYKAHFSMVLVYQDWGRLDEAEIYARMALNDLNEDKEVQPETREHFRRMLQKMLQRIEHHKNRPA